MARCGAGIVRGPRRVRTSIRFLELEALGKIIISRDSQPVFGEDLLFFLRILVLQMKRMVKTAG